MSALTLGLIAAVMWGFHDVCVRFVSQKTPLMASLLTVLVIGTVFHLGVMGVQQSALFPKASVLGISTLSGVFFLAASLGLYGAFQRGPVKLVSPIIASYPILSIAWAAWNGVSISALQLGAVVLIILGVSLVAALSDDSDGDVPPMGKTIAYSILASVGFAGTFALGQMASAQAGELPVTLVTRLVAIALLLIGILTLKLPVWPGRAALPVLSLMGLADGIALLMINSAGHLPDAQYAAVASSMFGLLTIVFAWIFLKERLSTVQWLGCLIAFAGIGYLAL
jgi:drug/metabolite transporter (DMT)-like permease